MKNKIFVIILLLVFIVSFTNLKAQENSSFLGKRVLFNFSTTISPSWFSPTFFFKNETIFTFNFDICPNVEVIVWQKGTVGAVYHWHKTRYNSGYSKIINNGYSPIRLELNVQGFGIYYKQYIRANNSRAPIGTYFRFQLDDFICSTKMLDKESLKHNLVAAKIEIGHDYLFWDKLRLSTGLSFGLPFSKFYIFYDIPYIEENSKKEQIEQNYKDHINKRLLRHYIFGASISIGFLAF